MDQAFYQKLLETFRIEADEHIQNISDGIIKLEQTSADEERSAILEHTFREAHSLKGASRAVGISEIETICHTIETAFSSLKLGQLEPSPELFDLLLQSNDLIYKFLHAAGDEEKMAQSHNIDDVNKTLSDYLILNTEDSPEKIKKKTPLKKDISKSTKTTAIHPAPAAAAPTPPPATMPIRTQDLPAADTVRVSTGKIDELFVKTQEILSTKFAFEQIYNKMFGIETDLAAIRDKFRMIRFELQNNSQSSAETVEQVLNQSEKLTGALSGKIKNLLKETGRQYRASSGNISGLIENIKDVLLLPFSHITAGFPKLVRDLSRDLGKEAELHIEGADAQCDKRILDELKDGLVHILRNSIDHGIEKPQMRRNTGKNSAGQIKISIQTIESNKVSIVIEDNGVGINIDRLKRTLIQKQILESHRVDILSEEDLVNFIFYSDVSTAENITDISGRGLGMAIVKEKIEKLDGSISVESFPGKGLRISILIPIYLSSLRGIIFKCNDSVLAIPTIRVSRVLRINATNIKTVGNKETVNIEGFPVALVRMSDKLQLKGVPMQNSSGYITCLYIKSGEKRAAFKIDAVLDEREIIIKQFNQQLSRVKYISGASLMADGSIIPVLNVLDLILSVEREGRSSVLRKEESPAGEKNILVVDDSITSRMLVKDILESFGYKVSTAFDGLDAMQSLKAGKFDMVVSDVEMPRMTGFELTASIRQDITLRNLPVILVTALAKNEDREKGLQAGANAYIVKSSFDQSALLDTIERLL